MTTMTSATSTTMATISPILETEEQLSQLEETVADAKGVGAETLEVIAEANTERQSLSFVSNALYSLKNLFFCFQKENSEYDQCKSSSATEAVWLNTSFYLSSTTTTDKPGSSTTPDVQTTTASTAGIETLSEIEAAASIAATVKNEAEIVIAKAEAEKKSLGDVTATLSVLQGLFLTLGSGSRQDSRSLTALALASHFGTAATLAHEDGVAPKPEEIPNFARDLSRSNLPATCEDLVVEMKKVTVLLESSISDALALANNLSLVDRSNFNCTPSQLNSLNKEVSTATNEARDLAKQETEKINRQYENITIAFDSIIKVNDDLKNLGEFKVTK